MAERGHHEEEQSIWKSRLAKFGIVVAAVGAAFGKFRMAAAGVMIFGIGLAAQRRK